MFLSDKASQTLITRTIEPILQKYYKTLKSNVQMPLMLKTFILPEEYQKFNEEWNLRLLRQRQDTNIWILKPSKGSMSKGIHIVTNPNEIQIEYMKKPKSYVIQEYLTNPFLSDNKKTELRVVVTITSMFPTIRAYISNLSQYNIVKYGLRDYSLDPSTFNDKCLHFRLEECKLDRYSTFQTTSDFYKLYLENNSDKIQNIEIQIEEIVTTYLLTAQRNQDWLNLAQTKLYNNYNAYQQFSFDFFLDNEQNVVLNEVNGIPTQGFYYWGKYYAAMQTLVGYNLPPNLNQMQIEWLGKCLNTNVTKELLFNEKLYQLEIPKADKQKHKLVLKNVRECFPCNSTQWNHFMAEIINAPTPAEIRYLVLTFDETARGNINSTFRRLLPIDSWQTKVHKDIYERLNYYSTFLIKDVPGKALKFNTLYYYLLHESWVWKYGTEERIIKELTKFTLKKYHLQ